MNLMSYKGLNATAEFDGEDEIFVGRIVGINDVIGFHADSVRGLKEAFREAVDDYLAACERVGKSPERPYSGKMLFRVSPEIHALASLAAQVSGKSLNQWGEDVLRSAVRPVMPAAEGG